MGELPVTIRLLDPPLHEFLPNASEENDELLIKIAKYNTANDISEYSSNVFGFINNINSMNENNESQHSIFVILLS